MYSGRRKLAMLQRAVQPQLLCRTLTQGAAGGDMVMTSGRLQALMKAEMSFLQGKYNIITVEKVLQSMTPYKVALIIQKELPARFATRLMEIEAVSEWRSLPSLFDVHSMLIESFYNLRLVNLDEDNMQPFIDVIKDLRSRHRPILQLLTQAARELTDREVMPSDKVREFITKFLESRIGTEMLTAHFVHLLEKPDGQGIVDRDCDPISICETTIGQVRSSALASYKEEEVPRIRLVAQRRDIRFPFLSKYLANMIDELLKNSVTATVLLRRKLRDTPQGFRRQGGRGGDIEVTVSADHNQIGIHISDGAGGVSFGESEMIWDYLYTKTPEHMQSNFHEETPLSGPGLGLPLCRLYANYLKGSFDLMSVPGVGTDAYLFFNRLDPTGTASVDCE